MSVTDQAFIRAYDETVTSTSVAPAPHGKGASIHVGVGIVPPPHADFRAAESTGTMQRLSRSNTLASPAALHSQSMGGSMQRAAAPTPPHAAFGQSPKISLSSFTQDSASSLPIAESALPALEIDSVRWPSMCESLLAFHNERFDRLIDQLRCNAQSGQKAVAITGITRGEGRTTFALCLARRFAAAGVKLALVDADFARPQIAQQLGISVQHGWETVLAGEKQLWEVMIESLSDRLTLLPLADQFQANDAPPVYRLAASLSELTDHYDVVLLDAGPLGDESVAPQWLLEPAAGVQGVILAHDSRRSEAGHLAAGCLQLADARLRQLGIAEMFVAEQLAEGCGQ